MGMKSVILGIATAGAIALSPVAVAAPASAAPVTFSSASITIVAPDSYGQLLCNGDLCLQRITSVLDNEAYVEAWANTQTFTGKFILYLNGAEVGRSGNTDKKWLKGGPGWLAEWPAGGGYTMKAVRNDGVVIGEITFRI